jgi:hypothetical protein
MIPAGILISRRSSLSGRISGTWTLSGETPAAGYPVLLYPVKGDGSTAGQLLARTNAEGHYEAHVEAGPYLVAFGDARLRTSVPAGGDVRLDYAVPPSGEVTVRLVGYGGISNALVSLVVVSAKGAVHEMLARTAPGGTARFTGVPKGEGEVTAASPKREGGTPIYAALTFAAPGEGSLEIELRAPSAALHLYVVDDSGRPVEGAAVELWSRLHRGSPDVKSSGAEGRASFTDLIPGRVSVRASMPGHSPRIAEFQAKEGGARQELVLPSGRRMPVRVALVTGEPMQIVLRAMAHHDPPPGRMWEAKTGEDGIGTIEDLPKEDIRLRFLAAGCKEVVLDLPAGAASAEVRFERVAK